MPAQPIPELRTLDQPGRLLSDGVARGLPQTDAAGNALDWTNGVSSNSICGAGGGATDCADAGVEKTHDALGAAYTFESFLLEHGRECDLASRSLTEEQAKNALNRLRSSFFAKELHQSSTTNATTLHGFNPDLRNTAEDVTGLTTAVLANSLQPLIADLQDEGITEILIHAPRFTIPAFLKEQLIEPVGGRWMIGGLIPISFDSYPNQGPVTLGNGVETPPDGEAWIWATSPVEWAVGATETTVSTDGIASQQNTAIALAQQLGVLRFDPCKVKAVQAQVC